MVTSCHILSFPLSFCLQFFGVIVSWLYMTRVEDAITEYGHYMDLLDSSAHQRAAKRQGHMAKWFKCMPEFDWWRQKTKSSKWTPANTHSWLNHSSRSRCCCSRCVNLPLNCRLNICQEKNVFCVFLGKKEMFANQTFESLIFRRCSQGPLWY